MPSIIPVDAPLAAPPKYGLLATLTPEKTGDLRWFTPDSVISYKPEGCSEGATKDPCNPSNNTAQSSPADVEWHAYILDWMEECSGFSGDEDFDEGRAVRGLNMDTERQLGAEFWDGNLTQTATMPVSGDPWPNTWLANVADVDILSESGAVGFTHALACLEQYAAENNGGQQAAIHATVQTIVHWESFRLLRKEGGKILTFQDNLVIQSPGYSGTSPDGTIGDSNIWAYVTDVPRIFLGPVKTFPQEQTYNRDENTTTVYAARPALVEWQRCRHGGVRLAQDTCDPGGS